MRALSSVREFDLIGFKFFRSAQTVFMKKFILTALAAVCLLAPNLNKMPRRSAGAEELCECKAAYLCDFQSGTAAYRKDETKRLPIASMCKIMTLLLSFEAVDAGNLSYDESICVSESAAGMGGSQVFLEAGLSYSAEELMKTVAVCSANDSCVALAERIAGSESLFVEKMNERARALGAENTLFANCTGLPKEPQYSCAKDVALMLRELLKHQKYFEFSKIWLEDFKHPDGRVTTITNTNKLIRNFGGCDGGKTGFTSQAGFCLAATAKRGEMRLISVVIGAENSDKRFQSVKNLFGYAFANFECQTVVPADEPLAQKLPVSGCKQKEIALKAERPLTVFTKKGEKADARWEACLHPVKAPFASGTPVGEAVLYLGGVEIDRCNLLAAEACEKYTFGEAFRETARNFN